MKKVLALVLAVIMLMAVAAAETVNTKETIKVGVVQLVDMANSDSAYEGMLATIAEAGLSDKIIVERQSAAGDAGTMTKGGALCSYGVDYTIVGNMTGEMIVEWYNGTALEDMPCRRYSEFSLVINSDVQAALGIELPENYAAQATYVTTVRAN